MATQEAYTPEPASTKHSVDHPLNPLTSSEISAASELIRSAWPPHTDLRFKIVTLFEPAKKQFIPYLEAEHNGRSLPSIARKAFIAYYIRNTVRLFPLQHSALTLPGSLSRSDSESVEWKN